MTDTKTNREIVQQGLDARAEARAEATQEAQEALFLEELNKITAANHHTAELLREAQKRVREKRKAERKAKHQEEAKATRRDTFMQRIFTALCIIAATIWMYTIGAVAYWLALTINISGLLYIIAKSVGYFTHDKREEK